MAVLLIPHPAFCKSNDSPDIPMPIQVIPGVLIPDRPSRKVFIRDRLTF